MDSHTLNNNPRLFTKHHRSLKCWRLLHGCIVVFLLITSINAGSTCEAPSSPQCFRRKTDETIYICEWSMNTTKSDVTFDLYFNETKFGGIKKNYTQFNEEQLIKHRPVYIRVEGHTGNSTCRSTKRSVVLVDTAVKYEAPQSISMSWLRENLKLSWKAVEKDPALAEVQFRRYDHPTESWENVIRTNTSSEKSMYSVIIENLLMQTAYQVQIRHRSSQLSNPLWSDWSSVATVPAELEQKPEVTMKITFLNRTRKVTLTWKPMPHAAAVTGVNYSLTPSHGCPCERRTIHHVSSNEQTIYVSYSAVNINITARNTAGYSPPAVIRVPRASTADLQFLEVCNQTLLNEKMKKRTCLELNELHGGDSRPENMIILMGRKNKRERNKIKATIKDVHYLYFEHRCRGGRPQTVKMCLFYPNDDVPLSAPQDFNLVDETPSSVILSWKAIPTAEQRGFLTHYSLCSVKISPEPEPKVCHNISASLVEHRLENLTPGAKYNITLAGLTRKGEGPRAILPIKTLPEKPVNVLWSLSLLILFFFITTLCPFFLKRIRPKLCPPVPTPVIPDFTYEKVSESQEMLERKEEVHELTLHQPHPECKSNPEDTEQTTVLRGEWDDGSDKDVDNERSDSRMSGGASDERSSHDSTDQALRSSRGDEMTDLEQLDNEIAMLIYRNGLVFDVKTDSP